MAIKSAGHKMEPFPFLLQLLCAELSVREENYPQSQVHNIASISAYQILYPSEEATLKYGLETRIIVSLHFMHPFHKREYKKQTETVKIGLFEVTVPVSVWR